ncbi:hypothetical protein [Kitasatospora cheerisanensis]|uniref:Lipoprotein n=1 Tax=Kitasatospora cheerisanensis KCTC 2395 TaxID=1348663 RepID=A0A066Z3T7_9ACTN|nr:hypothetical protein [Kitasatospora cheerisanensis]KDN84820.1 hypothetical protein KCH_33470 [Kitasatospora cheerisanensis KCTC 2395]
MRALRTLAAAALAAGLLTACSSGSGSNGAADAKPNATAPGGSSASAGAGGAGASGGSGAGAGQGGVKLGAKEALLASAAVMEKAGSAKLTISGGTEGTGEFVWKSPKSFLIDTKSDGKDAKVLFVGEVMYIGAGADMAALAGGKTWMKIDPKAAAQGAPGGSDAGGFATTMELMNPAVQLAVAAPTATEAGTESVAGQNTTHYRSDIPVDALVAKMDLSPELKAQVLAELKKKGSTTTTEFWINAKGEVVQQSSNSMSTGSAKILYSALGTVQPTKAPADSEVFSLTDLLKQ